MQVEVHLGQLVRAPCKPSPRWPRSLEETAGEADFSTFILREISAPWDAQILELGIGQDLTIRFNIVSFSEIHQ